MYLSIYSILTTTLRTSRAVRHTAVKSLCTPHGERYRLSTMRMLIVSVPIFKYKRQDPIVLHVHEAGELIWSWDSCQNGESVAELTTSKVLGMPWL